MRAVVDTNVIAYLLLGTQPFFDECRQFWRNLTEPVAPASWQAELTNVLWMALRKDIVDLHGSLERLHFADSLGIRSVAVGDLWHGALGRAHASGVAAYDTLFVELADREGIPLATFDAPLIKAFPDLASRPRALTDR